MRVGRMTTETTGMMAMAATVAATGSGPGERRARRTLARAALAAAVALGVGGGIAAPQAGAATGQCPWWHSAPAGLTCVDEDVHETYVGLGDVRLTTNWYTDEHGVPVVAMRGTMELTGLGENVLTAELRTASGDVIGSTSWTLRRTDVWQPWWRDVRLNLHGGEAIASVRYTLRNPTTNSVGPVKISRPTD